MWKSTRNLRRSFSSSPSTQRRTPRSSNPYPYPQNPNPTPHQIFHLPYQASQDDIKRRYYDLVRIHHPDSPVVRALDLTSDVAHSRFQAISAAYDVLRGRNTSGNESDSDARRTAQPPPAAARRGTHASRADAHMLGDDRWKDRIIIGAVVLTIVAFVVQTAMTRFQALAAKEKNRKSQP